ncbi:MAG: DMT family transporter [Burkholderiales bacterium]|jgi:drug/metabolite transporter (DMT)-like permease|nr:DMT family transporter [Burkholderiales bacterium]
MRPVGFDLARLAAGVAVVATASILIRVAQQHGAASLAIATGRLGLAALLLAPFVWLRAGAELRAAPRSVLALAAASGVVLALHFAAWITSLEHTSVAASAVLVTTNPLWVGLLAWGVLREPPSRRAWLGIALGLAGGLAVFAAPSADDIAARAGRPLLGNALAVVGALAASAYLLLGRALRGQLSLLAYVGIAYGSAAVTLAAAAIATDADFGRFDVVAWAAVVALALGPQLVGHTTFNWAVRRFPAPLVAMAILGEPVGAALLAWLLFGERVSGVEAVGFALLLAGIFVAASGSGDRRQSIVDHRSTPFPRRPCP